MRELLTLACLLVAQGVFAQALTSPARSAPIAEKRQWLAQNCDPSRTLSMAARRICELVAQEADQAASTGNERPNAQAQQAASVSSGLNPIGGSKIRLHPSYSETGRGHRIYGTEQGLACWQRGAAQLDRAAEVFELTCPAVVIGCYLSAPSGASPDYGQCSGNTFPISMQRGDSYIGPALVRLPLSGKASVFVFAWNQCHWNSAMVRALPEGWAAACDMTLQDLAAELSRNNSAIKLEQLHRQRWQ
jgi:hypothetical protein